MSSNYFLIITFTFINIKAFSISIENNQDDESIYFSVRARTKTTGTGNDIGKISGHLSRLQLNDFLALRDQWIFFGVAIVLRSSNGPIFQIRTNLRGSYNTQVCVLTMTHYQRAPFF